MWEERKQIAKEKLNGQSTKKLSVLPHKRHAEGTVEGDGEGEGGKEKIDQIKDETTS